MFVMRLDDLTEGFLYSNNKDIIYVYAFYIVIQKTAADSIRD
jgi:hypothetical protein